MTDIVSLATFKQYMRKDGAGLDDPTLQGFLTAAIQGIANATDRRLVIVDGNTVATDWLVPESAILGSVMRIPDCTSVTSITENGAVLATTAYQLEPVNAMSLNGEARPYEQVRRLQYGWWYTDCGRAAITVKAKWGWTAIPPGLTEACLVLGKELCNNQDVRLGIAGLAEGVVSGIRQNKIVSDAINAYARGESVGSP